MPEPLPCAFVSRGGLKLRHALDEFALDPVGLTCADLGASTGGFTDCLLQAGAARVYSVDTAYGEFAWKLRNDPRVTLMERTNALHAQPPEGGVDLVVADVGWTPQRLVVPAAMNWLKPGGRLISLVKPHYEIARAALPRGGILPDEDAERIARSTAAAVMAMGGLEVLGLTPSPIRGGNHKGKGSGNAEWLMLVQKL